MSCLEDISDSDDSLKETTLNLIRDKQNMLNMPYTGHTQDYLNINCLHVCKETDATHDWLLVFLLTDMCL